MDRNSKKHIRINRKKESIPFTPVGRKGSKQRIPKRNRKEHGNYLENQFKKIWNTEVSRRKNVSSITKKEGIYLQFRGKENYELLVKSLEDVRQNVRLCNVKEVKGTKYSTVFIPSDKKAFFLKKISKYKNDHKGTDVVSSIESIKRAMVDELWTDKRDIPIKNKEACEVWLSVYKKDSPEEVVEKFFNLCRKFNIPYYENFIEFPERAVVSIMANIETLETILIYSSDVAEFRKNVTPASFYITDNNYKEQREWVNDLLERTTFKDSEFSVCILDKGINNGHPLISPVLKDIDMHTTFNDKIVQDISFDGHGTSMAGIATYFNLEEALESDEQLNINHSLESVRFIDDDIENDVDLYADVTSKAISLVEIEKPDNKRVIAMPVTAGFDYINRSTRLNRLI